MKFDRRVFPNIILFLILIVFVAVTSMCQSSSVIKIAYADDLMGISSKDYSINISYDDVESLELVETPEFGTLKDGKNRPELKSGIWENETWGEYYLCYNPKATNCVVVHLNSGKVCVFNCNTNEKTTETYQEFLTHIR